MKTKKILKQEKKSECWKLLCRKCFLNVIKLEAKVKDSPTIPKGKVISEETDKSRQESNEKENNTD